ncbi:MAG: insulinase family protein, partial [Betaproteobacteria bacterium]|nr:insulinase family protein [Betaproteobacteria bacterium]
MTQAFIRKKDLDSEMPVVRNEFEIGENNPVDIMNERILSTMYLWHNYGKATIGARSDIENVPIARLQAFYRHHYQPDNAVLLIAGRIDEARTLSLVQRHFGAIPKPQRVLQPLYTVEPNQDGERSVRLSRVGDTQAVGVGFHIPAMAHPDYALSTVLLDILVRTPSGRLHKALVETQKATRVSGSNFENRDPTAMLAWVELRKEQNLTEAKSLLIQTLQGFGAEPVTEIEVERSKAALLADIEQTTHVSVDLGLRLSEAIGAGDWRLYFLNRDATRNATRAEVQRVAMTYLKASNRTLGEYVPTTQPERVEIPLVADIAAVVKNYRGDPPIAPGEAFEASPENIERRTLKGTLPGGMKTALLSKKTRGETVSATIVLRMGDETNLRYQRINGDLAAAMLMRGTATRSREQINDEINRLKVQIDLSGGANQIVASIRAKRSTLSAALELVVDMMRHANMPETEFEQLRESVLAALEQSQLDPGALSQEAIGRHFNGYPKEDPRYYATLAEDIEAVRAAKRDDALAFYRDYYGSNQGQIAIVGDFDTAEIQKQLPQLLGDWQAKQNVQRLSSQYRDTPAEAMLLETPDKESATFLARININLNENDPDYPVLVLADWLLGGGAGFSARLVARMRVKEGLSYSVSSSLNVSALDRTGSWTAYAQYAPQNRERLLAAFKDEMQTLQKNGFTAQDVVAAKSGYTKSQLLARSSDSQLAETLVDHLYLGRSFAWERDMEQKIQSLRPADLQQAMQKYLDVGRLTIANAGDFSKSSK